MHPDAALLAATLERPAGADGRARRIVRPPTNRLQRRVQALAALVAAAIASLETAVRRASGQRAGQSGRVASRGAGTRWPDSTRLGWPRSCWPTIGRLEPELRPTAIELLTERRDLGRTIARRDRPPGDSRRGPERQPGAAICWSEATTRWPKKSKPTGARSAGDRDPKREEVIAQMRTLLAAHAGRRPARAGSLQARLRPVPQALRRRAGRRARTSRSTAAVRSSSCCRMFSIPAWSSALPIRLGPWSPPMAAC